MNATASKYGSMRPANSGYKFGGRTNSHRRRRAMRAPDRDQNHDRIATLAQWTFILLGLVAFAYFARIVVVPVLFACVAALALKTPVSWLVHCRLPTALASALVLGVFVAGISFAATYLGRPAVAWAASAPETIPRLRMKFQHVLQPAAHLSAAASSVGTLVPAADNTRKATPVEVKDNHVANSVFSWTSNLLAGIGETLVLVFLLLASGDTFMHKLVRIMPRLRDKKQAVEISREIQHSISTYLFSVGLINLCLGLAVAAALHLVGMPNALMWGGVAACVNFIPYFGPVLGVVAVGLGGLLAFDPIGRGLLPAGLYFVLHFIEANLITPHVLGRRFTLNPVIIFVALIFGIWLLGAAGALLAVPLLVTAKVICDRVPSLHLLGGLLAPHKTRGDEAEAQASPHESSLERVSVHPVSRFL